MGSLGASSTILTICLHHLPKDNTEKESEVKTKQKMISTTRKQGRKDQTIRKIFILSIMKKIKVMKVLKTEEIVNRAIVQASDLRNIKKIHLNLQVEQAEKDNIETQKYPVM